MVVFNQECNEKSKEEKFSTKKCRTRRNPISLEKTIALMGV